MCTAVRMMCPREAPWWSPGTHSWCDQDGRAAVLTFYACMARLFRGDSSSLSVEGTCIHEEKDQLTQRVAPGEEAVHSTDESAHGDNHDAAAGCDAIQITPSADTRAHVRCTQSSVIVLSDGISNTSTLSAEDDGASYCHEPRIHDARDDVGPSDGCCAPALQADHVLTPGHEDSTGLLRDTRTHPHSLSLPPLPDELVTLILCNIERHLLGCPR